MRLRCRRSSISRSCSVLVVLIPQNRTAKNLTTTMTVSPLQRHNLYTTAVRPIQNKSIRNSVLISSNIPSLQYSTMACISCMYSWHTGFTIPNVYWNKGKIFEASCSIILTHELPPRSATRFKQFTAVVQSSFWSKSRPKKHNNPFRQWVHQVEQLWHWRTNSFPRTTQCTIPWRKLEPTPFATRWIILSVVARENKLIRNT